jgi:hypothetical protein
LKKALKHISERAIERVPEQYRQHARELGSHVLPYIEGRLEGGALGAAIGAGRGRGRARRSMREPVINMGLSGDQFVHGSSMDPAPALPAPGENPYFYERESDKLEQKAKIVGRALRKKVMVRGRRVHF